MKRNMVKFGSIAAAGLVSVVSAHAQLPVSSYTANNDELILGFTVPGSTGDLVIDLGTATQVGVGGSTTVDLIAHNNVGVSAAVLQGQLNGLYGSMDSIQWGVVGGHYSSGLNNATYSTVPHGAAAPAVNGGPGQVAGAINTAGAGLNDFVGSPSNQGTVDPTQLFGESWTEIIAPGTLGSSFTQRYYNPDQTTSGSFSSGLNFQQADLYFSSASAPTPVLKGVITLGSDGSLTFAPSTTTPPPPPFLKITRVGTTCTISFLTTNGATYTLYYTNSAGTRTSVSGWPTNSTTITGNNATNSFVDTTSDSSRIYRVGAH
jgi:hypothetical protein